MKTVSNPEFERTKLKGESRQRFGAEQRSILKSFLALPGNKIELIKLGRLGGFNEKEQVMLDSFIYWGNVDLPVDRAWSKTFLEKFRTLDFFQNLKILAVKNRKIRILRSFLRSTPRVDRRIFFYLTSVAISPAERAIAKAARPLCNKIRLREVSDCKNYKLFMNSQMIYQNEALDLYITKK